jgi:hypothetical protein
MKSRIGVNGIAADDDPDSDPDTDAAPVRFIKES